MSDLVCNYCGSAEGIELESARTAYEPRELTRYDVLLADDPLDPPSYWERFKAANPDIPYCRECAAEHHAFWDDQWAEYYVSQG